MKQPYLYSLWMILRTLGMGGALSMLILTGHAAGEYAPASEADPIHNTTSTRRYAYTPPPDSTQPEGGTNTTGSRSCGTGDHGLTLLSLAPREHVGMTAMSHPTFVWYVPDTHELPMTFRLYKMDGTAAVRRQTKSFEASWTSAPGVMTFDLPENHAGLRPGQHYLWQVILQCDADDPSALTIAEAELMVASEIEQTSLAAIVSSATLPESLIAPTAFNPAAIAEGNSRGSTASMVLDAIDNYAEAGLWYDAVGLAFFDPADASLQPAQLALIEDLATLEAAAEPTGFTQQLQDLVEYLYSNP